MGTRLSVFDPFKRWAFGADRPLGTEQESMAAGSPAHPWVMLDHLLEPSLTLPAWFAGPIDARITGCCGLTGLETLHDPHLHCRPEHHPMALH